LQVDQAVRMAGLPIPQGETAGRQGVHAHALSKVTTADHESLQIIQLDFTALRIKLRAWGAALPWDFGPALNGALRVPQSGGGFSGGGAGLATIRLGSCGNVAVRIGGLCRGRSVIDRGGGTSSGIPTVVPTEPTETKSIELPTTEAVVLPTPEAGALTTSEAGVQSLPKTGFRGCTSGRYVRKHNPWVNFAKSPASTNRPFSAFPRDFCKLPTVSFLSPNVSRHTRLLGPAAATVG
jgi:hypothetical protein